ncbi:beta-glucosidase [Novosphingobium chloroacetimidivorans]|uniref:Beta-glucosidase n=1 Tax=Novosphingobium chloroacetimidivorans TaxID=1428314 RepID=A0A7W7KB86_9SPHN|nr:glycoside hydrolase family 3 N-terminal domain-containing protein [Novosphingobium chloroacetimidivorans]MBB4858888.1 beta-glucosidase [Novosphingobium chloroacetimidivorans]
MLRAQGRLKGLPRAVSALALLSAFGATPGIAATPGSPLPWMDQSLVARQNSAREDAAREALADRRARLLLAALTLDQKMQQLTGAAPELLPELPECFGARHVSGIADLAIPTFRISNGPVGVGQNDCVARSVYDKVKDDPSPYAKYVAYTHPSSAQATAMPSAIGVAASFDPQVAALFGKRIAREMNDLALHVFEAPGVNIARLPIAGRNFEYFGEDPFLSGSMAVAEIGAIQDAGLIAMAKHYIANEQETNRQTIRETIDQQTLREIYLLPFEMAIKTAKVGAVMCAYNYVNGVSSCENKALLTDVLRKDWGFTGYVQSDFFAMKSTVPTLTAGMDHEMPLPQLWSKDKLTKALAAGQIQVADIDRALLRRYTQMFKAGIFDRKLRQQPIDFAAGGKVAREIGSRSAVLLQNNGALPIASDVKSIVLVGKATQVYAQQAVAGGALTGQPLGAGGGSSDVVPNYTVTPAEGLRKALGELGNADAKVRLVLVDDANSSASIDGAQTTFDAALQEIAKADSVVIMAGTISEEGADRATFTSGNGKVLAASAAAGSSLDWYAAKPNLIATNDPKTNPAQNSGTVAMVDRILAAQTATGRSMAGKTVLVLKDNAGPSLPRKLVGKTGPAILETWFPGQEDGNIVADVLFGRTNPSGKLPVTIPYEGTGFLDAIDAVQFPGTTAGASKDQTVDYAEKLHIGYRWYDANVSGRCAVVGGINPCVAFPFGHGLSYTDFAVGKPKLSRGGPSTGWTVTTKLTNRGKRAGAQVLQVYVQLPAEASTLGAKQPPRRLVGFGRAELKPGASRSVTVRLDPKASNHPFEVWSEARKSWVAVPGSHKIWVGTSSSEDDLQLAGSIAF